MKERHWISLVATLRHGQCVLVLGPEVPASFSDQEGREPAYPSVPEALARLLERELEEDGRRVTGGTLAAIAQQYEDAEGFGPNALRAFAERFYTLRPYRASEVHSMLAALPFSVILTTCHDHLLSGALQAAHKNPIVQKYHFRGDKRDNPEFHLPGSPDTPLVYHLFGDPGVPGSMVLSENDLLDFLIAIVSERPPLPNSLVRSLKRAGQSFLFLGFGIKQWTLRILIKVLIRTLELHRTCSAIASEPLRDLLENDREQTILFYQRGTRIELEDQDVTMFLSELTRRLEAEGGFAGKALPIGPRPRIFISYAREDQDIAASLFDKLQNANFEPWLDTECIEGGELWDERIKDELELSDFVLVLCTPNFSRKSDSYVNKEVALAKNRAMNVRGPFLFPLLTEELPAEERLPELRPFQWMLLRPAHLDEDFSKLASALTRDYQRRNR